jgi:hypothetical protein
VGVPVALEVSSGVSLMRFALPVGLVVTKYFSKGSGAL